MVDQSYITRSSDPYDEPEYFAEHIERWFIQVIEPMKTTYLEEPDRLLKKKEYRAAVISAISLFESYIRERLAAHTNLRKTTKSLYSLVQLAIDYEIINAEMMGNLKQWMHVRNNAVHTNRKVSYHEARRIVNGIKEIMNE